MRARFDRAEAGGLGWMGSVRPPIPAPYVRGGPPSDRAVAKRTTDGKQKHREKRRRRNRPTFLSQAKTKRRPTCFHKEGKTATEPAIRR